MKNIKSWPTDEAGEEGLLPFGTVGDILVSQYVPDAVVVEYVYRGPRTRSQVYRGTRSDAQLYRGNRVLFPA